jgi:hypothetical protein
VGRYVLIGLGAVIVIAIVLVFVLREGDPDLGSRVPEIPGLHQPPYSYNTNPPTSGNHVAIPGRYGFWGAPLVPEQVVHNMEHGAAVIWYAPDDPALAGSVNGLVRELGSGCLVAGSYASMGFPVVITVWGRLLELPAYDEVQIREFVEAYRGSGGPEAGLCWNEPLVPGEVHNQ